MFCSLIFSATTGSEISLSIANAEGTKNIPEARNKAFNVHPFIVILFVIEIVSYPLILSDFLTIINWFLRQNSDVWFIILTNTGTHLD